MTPPRRTVAVLGLGLIGSSLGLALGGRWHRVGYDPDPAVRRVSRRRSAVDALAESPEQAVQQASLVVLAASPGANRELLGEVASVAGRAVVTDVGSLKRDIARAGKRLLGGRFVPGHPMAGSEGKGPEAADPDLFRGAVWILCGGDRSSRARVRGLVRHAGARSVDMTPARHDRVVARTSHLPQVLASLVLGGAVGRDDLPAAGRTLREWGRIAASPGALWEEILTGNADAVLRELTRLERELRRFREGWEADPAAVRRMLARGRRRAAELD